MSRRRPHRGRCAPSSDSATRQVQNSRHRARVAQNRSTLTSSAGRRRIIDQERRIAASNRRFRATRGRQDLSRRRIPLRTAVAAALIACVTGVLFLARPAYALDPTKRLTQYLHTSWRIQDGSAPAPAYTRWRRPPTAFFGSRPIPQRSTDSTESGFFSRRFPYKGGSGNKVFKVFGGRAGGLWAVGSPRSLTSRTGRSLLISNWTVFLRSRTSARIPTARSGSYEQPRISRTRLFVT